MTPLTRGSGQHLNPRYYARATALTILWLRPSQIRFSGCATDDVGEFTPHAAAGGGRLHGQTGQSVVSRPVQSARWRRL